MESESNCFDYDVDNIFDDLNDYNLPCYDIDIPNFDGQNESELQFNGETQLAKQYSENEHPHFVDLCNHAYSNVIIDTEYEINEANNSSNSVPSLSSRFSFPSLSRNSNSNNISEALSLSMSLNSEGVLKQTSTDFQREHEPRIKYLLRSPKL